MKHKDITEKIIIYIMSCSLKELSQLTQYQIAETFDINKSYLSVKFKRDTNMTVYNFIEFEKFIRARVLLLINSDMTIEEISRIVGLEKTAHFSAKFKRYYFVTPGKYRQHLKKNCRRSFM